MLVVNDLTSPIVSTKSGAKISVFNEISINKFLIFWSCFRLSAVSVIASEAKQSFESFCTRNDRMSLLSGLKIPRRNPDFPQNPTPKFLPLHHGTTINLQKFADSGNESNAEIRFQSHRKWSGFNFIISNRFRKNIGISLSCFADFG